MMILVVNLLMTFIFCVAFISSLKIVILLHNKKDYVGAVIYGVVLGSLLVLAGYVGLNAWVDGFHLLELRGRS